MASEFRNLYDLHNGECYLAPTDLSVVPTKPKRVLIVGSCLAEVWQHQIDCPCDFVMTNNLVELPDQPPQSIENYDLQLVQISLRRVVTLYAPYALGYARYGSSPICAEPGIISNASISVPFRRDNSLTLS